MRVVIEECGGSEGATWRGQRGLVSGKNDNSSVHEEKLDSS